GTEIYKLLVLMNIIQKNYTYFMNKNINIGHFFYETNSKNVNIMNKSPKKFVKLDYTAETQVKNLEETFAIKEFKNTENIFFPFLGVDGYFQNEPRKEFLASLLRSLAGK
ncbi:MAG: hypothetical protein LBT51_08905, partial [Fusobacteriaceae bacterium]|nr:hypothetical protein [Fusobacteriaceae bacterium]